MNTEFCDCRGSYTGCPKVHVAWERKTGRDAPCPYNSFDRAGPCAAVPAAPSLYRLRAQSLVEIVVKAVEIVKGPI